MAQKQTRRSISVKGSTDLRIRQFATDHGTSSSGAVEDVLTEKLGEATEHEVSVYEAYELERQARPPTTKAKAAAVPEPSPFAPFDPSEDVPSKLSKTGPELALSATDRKQRPTLNQPKHKEPKSKVKLGEEESEDMKGYVPPNLLF